jgi:hypothetical protein
MSVESIRSRFSSNGLKQIDGEIYAKKMSLKSKLEYEEASSGLSTEERIAHLLIRTICDESGNLAFSESDVASLLNDGDGQLAGVSIKQIMEMNGFRNPAEASEAKKD